MPDETIKRALIEIARVNKERDDDRKAVKSFYSKDQLKILDELRTEVISALKQKGHEGEQKDGMDLALHIIDRKNMKIEFAAIPPNSFFTPFSRPFPAPNMITSINIPQPTPNAVKNVLSLFLERTW